MKILYLFLGISTLFSAKNVYTILNSNLKKCQYHQVFNSTNTAFYIPGKSNKTILVLSGVHGEEKGAVQLNAHFLYNICQMRNEQTLNVLSIVVLNQWGYDRGLRRNKNKINLNRDGINKETQAETKWLEWLIRLYKPDYFVDLHQWGKVVLVPSIPHEKSEKFHRKLGIKYYRRPIRVKGDYVTLVAKKYDIPSLLIEIGRKSDGLKFTPQKQKEVLPYVLRKLIEFTK